MDYIPRLAKNSDKDHVLNFCEKTFSWGDYIHEVWDSWIDEGNLIVMEQNQIPISMTHAAFYPNEKMIWIEGIRVKENFRKNGVAQKMILYLEETAKSKNCELSRMLIASENEPSLSLAKKLGYKILSKWNYFSLESKPINEEINIGTDSCIDSVNLDENNSHFIESWRWIPLTDERLKKLNSEKKIFCQKDNEKINTLGIITESESFENTIILELVFGNNSGKMIKFTQNLAYKKNYSKIRILTKLDSLPSIDNLQNKFPFYLMEKKL